MQDLCDNMTFGAEAPKRRLRDNNHPELHFSQLDFYRDVSPNWAHAWSRVIFSSYVLISPLHLCTSQKNILLRYLSEIVHLSRHAVVILDCGST